MFKLFRFLKPKIWLIIIVFILIGAQSYSQLSLPRLMGEIVANITSPAGADNTFILRKGLEMFAYAGATIVIALATSLSVSYVGAYFGKKVRSEVFKKVLAFSPGDYDRIGTASLMTRTTNDVEMVQTIVIMGLRIMVMSPVIMAIAIVQVLRTDQQLALILAFSIPLIIITIIILFAIAMPLFKKLQIAIDEVTKVLRASLTGVRVVRAFNQEEKEQKRFAKVNQHQTNIVVKVGRTMSFASPLISIFFDLTYFAIFLFGFAIIDGTANAARLDNILVTSQYAMHIMMSFLMFSMLLINIPRAGVSARRINEVLDTKIVIKDPDNPATAPNEFYGHVRFEDVTFTFPDSEVPTLQNITFEAKPGQVTAIIGSTGSGKSSIINLIPRFYDISKGHIFVDDVDVRDYAQKDLRDKIGFVPQQALLFSGTIRDNMRFGKPDSTDDDIKVALEVAQATRFVAKKENGYDAEVSQGGKNFSGGQKQRIAIARALVKKPEIYIFDDSFSALDFKTDIRLRTALKEYTKKASVIIVAQRVSSIMDADNILVLNEGRIVGQGKHQSLLKNCKVYQEIVFSQMDESEIKRTLEIKKQVLLTEGGDE
ncbi:MAG: ABC transporter ATP-binding protein [Erysipelotrichia bacterium]|jgi:ATP-binding cassette subfamily B protein|nr:ABC transporter ATP-binding protein [Erysipelotrichia bacterium]